MPHVVLPILDVKLPRRVQAIHQIELTSRCNLKCSYCPSPDIVSGKYPGRRAEDMTRDTFERALEWVAHFVKAGTQTELNLAGIGESTLHPNFGSFVRLAREAVGPHVKLILATNGLKIVEDWDHGHGDTNIADVLAAERVETWVSLHVPAKGAMADKILRDRGVAGKVSLDGAINANDWAGQVAVPWREDYRMPCQWIREAKAFVFSSGQISTCCLDASGRGVIGHVDQEIRNAWTEPYGLCGSCYQVIGVKGYAGQG